MVNGSVVHKRQAATNADCYSKYDWVCTLDWVFVPGTIIVDHLHDL